MRWRVSGVMSPRNGSDFLPDATTRYVVVTVCFMGEWYNAGMAGYFFGERLVYVVGETFEPKKRGIDARARLRSRMIGREFNPIILRDAANLGLTFIGNEQLPMETLIDVARKRFAAAGGRADVLGDVQLESSVRSR